MAMAIVTSEMIWIKSFLAALRLLLEKPIGLFYDNQATLQIAKNLVFYKRTKHIEIECHFVRERLLAGDLTTGFVPSKY